MKLLKICDNILLSILDIEDGMLGGLSKISDVDLKGSQRFLNSIYQVILYMCSCNFIHNLT